VSLPGDVHEFLAGLAGDKTLEQLRAEEAMWRNSADLNESFLAATALRAAELLEKYAPETEGQ
jgi:hypothetical protein